MRMFEDYQVGETECCGTFVVPGDEIVAFALRWDPQTMHTRGACGKPVVASGVHLLAIAVRALVTHKPRPDVVAGIGWDSVRFLEPVFAGDRLTIRRSCIATRRSRSKPDRGVVSNRLEVTNQHGRVAFQFDDSVIVRCRGEGG